MKMIWNSTLNVSYDEISSRASLVWESKALVEFPDAALQ